MNLEELEEELEAILPGHFRIDTDNNGQIIILTGLQEDDDGELVECDLEGDDDEEFDEDFEPLPDEDEDDD